MLESTVNHTGLEQHEGEYILSFHFRWTIPLRIIIHVSLAGTNKHAQAQTNKHILMVYVCFHMLLLCSGWRANGGRVGAGLLRSRELWQRLLKLGPALMSMQLPCKRSKPGPLRPMLDVESGLIVISATGAWMLKLLADITLFSSMSNKLPMLLGRALAGLWLVWRRSEGSCELVLLLEVWTQEFMDIEEPRSSNLRFGSTGESVWEDDLSLLQDCRLSDDRRSVFFEWLSTIPSKEQLLDRSLANRTSVLWAWGISRQLPSSRSPSLTLLPLKTGCCPLWVSNLVSFELKTSLMGESASSKASFLIKLSRRHSVDLNRLAAFTYGFFAGCGQLGSSWFLRFPRWVLGAVL